MRLGLGRLHAWLPSYIAFSQRLEGRGRKEGGREREGRGEGEGEGGEGGKDREGEAGLLPHIHVDDIVVLCMASKAEFPARSAGAPGVPLHVALQAEHARAL